MILALNWAKADGNVSLDLLARLAVIKLLRTELHARNSTSSSSVSAPGRRAFEGPRQANISKGIEIRERCAAFQLAKRQLLRKAGQELFQTLREVEKETLARMRRALFGAADPPGYVLLLNRLMFTEDGRDDYINAEHYVMLGNFERDPDRFSTLQEIAHVFLASLDLPVPEGQRPRRSRCAAQRPGKRAGAGRRRHPRRVHSQGPRPEGAARRLDRYPGAQRRHGPHHRRLRSRSLARRSIRPSFTRSSSRTRSSTAPSAPASSACWSEHTRLSPDNFEAALRRINNYRAADRAKVAGRFLRDLICYHRDLRSLEALNRALDTVNVIGSDRLRELSAINTPSTNSCFPRSRSPPRTRSSTTSSSRPTCAIPPL